MGVEIIVGALLMGGATKQPTNKSKNRNKDIKIVTTQPNNKNIFHLA
jgi:hypothetical protein